MNKRYFCLVLLCFAYCVSFAWTDENADAAAPTCEDNQAAKDWCVFLKTTTSANRGCDGFTRMVSSASEKKTIVFKLLENLWHNCPKTCFDCDISKRVPAALINKSEEFLNNRITDETLIGKVATRANTPDTDRWLEVNAVLEHLFVCENAEDAAIDEYFEENVQMTICEKWKDELKTTEFIADTVKLPDGTEQKRCRDVEKPINLDAITMYNLPANLKDGMHWWCRETCNLCSRQKDIVSHHYFSF